MSQAKNLNREEKNSVLKNLKVSDQHQNCLVHHQGHCSLLTHHCTSNVSACMFVSPCRTYWTETTLKSQKTETFSNHPLFLFFFFPSFLWFVFFSCFPFTSLSPSFMSFSFSPWFLFPSCFLSSIYFSIKFHFPLSLAFSLLPTPSFLSPMLVFLFPHTYIPSTFFLLPFFIFLPSQLSLFYLPFPLAVSSPLWSPSVFPILSLSFYLVLSCHIFFCSTLLSLHFLSSLVSVMFPLLLFCPSYPLFSSPLCISRATRQQLLFDLDHSVVQGLLRASPPAESKSLMCNKGRPPSIPPWPWPSRSANLTFVAFAKLVMSLRYTHHRLLWPSDQFCFNLCPNIFSTLSFSPLLVELSPSFALHPVFLLCKISIYSLEDHWGLI